MDIRRRHFVSDSLQWGCKCREVDTHCYVQIQLMFAYLPDMLELLRDTSKARLRYKEDNKASKCHDIDGTV